MFGDKLLSTLIAHLFLTVHSLPLPPQAPIDPPPPSVIMASSPSSTTTTLYPDHIKEAAKDVLASVVGSAMCVYTGQPFDTVKV